MIVESKDIESGVSTTPKQWNIIHLNMPCVLLLLKKWLFCAKVGTNISLNYFSSEPVRLPATDS
jgi:hypothetical protein